MEKHTPEILDKYVIAQKKTQEDMSKLTDAYNFIIGLPDPTTVYKFSPGCIIDAAQRKQLIKLLTGKKVKVAIIEKAIGKDITFTFKVII